MFGSSMLSSLHTGTTEPPTPHYNNSILCDTVMLSHLHFLSNAATDFPGMKDGLALLKVWLNQRQLSKVCPVPRWALLTLLASLPLACSPSCGRRVVLWSWCFGLVGGVVACGFALSSVRFSWRPCPNLCAAMGLWCFCFHRAWGASVASWSPCLLPTC